MYSAELSEIGAQGSAFAGSENKVQHDSAAITTAILDIWWIGQNPIAMNRLLVIAKTRKNRE
jgi:hypothetical protein